MKIQTSTLSSFSWILKAKDAVITQKSFCASMKLQAKTKSPLTSNWEGPSRAHPGTCRVAVAWRRAGSWCRPPWTPASWRTSASAAPGGSPKSKTYVVFLSLSRYAFYFINRQTSDCGLNGFTPCIHEKNRVLTRQYGTLYFLTFCPRSRDNWKLERKFSVSWKEESSISPSFPKVGFFYIKHTFWNVFS